MTVEADVSLCLSMSQFVNVYFILPDEYCTAISSGFSPFVNLLWHLLQAVRGSGPGGNGHGCHGGVPAERLQSGSGWSRDQQCDKESGEWGGESHPVLRLCKLQSDCVWIKLNCTQWAAPNAAHKDLCLIHGSLWSVFLLFIGFPILTRKIVVLLRKMEIQVSDSNSTHPSSHPSIFHSLSGSGSQKHQVKQSSPNVLLPIPQLFLGIPLVYSRFALWSPPCWTWPKYLYREASRKHPYHIANPIREGSLTLYTALW